MLDGKTLIKVGKQSVHNWVNENLSLSKELPKVKSVPPPVVEKLLEQLKYSIPGSAPAVKNLFANFVLDQSSSDKTLSPVKETPAQLASKKPINKLASKNLKKEIGLDTVSTTKKELKCVQQKSQQEEASRTYYTKEESYKK